MLKIFCNMEQFTKQNFANRNRIKTNVATIEGLEFTDGQASPKRCEDVEKL